MDLSTPPPERPGFARRLRTRAAGFFGPTARKSLWALIDQVVVSGTRFVPTILIGRACGADELGLYAVAWSIIALPVVLQESLLLTPYAVLGRREAPRSRRRFAGSILIHLTVMALATAVVLGLAGTAAALAGMDRLAGVLWVVGAAMPFVLLHGFARRFAFAHLHVVTALSLDVAVGVVQIGGLVLLASTGNLTAVSALAVGGVASAVGAIPWLLIRRSEFVVRWRRAGPQLARNWSFGRWVVASQQVRAASEALLYWLLLAAVGTEATGVFAACWVVVTAANPLLLGLANVMEPKTAEAVADQGKAELVRVVRKVTRLVGLVLGVYTLFVVAVGGPVIAWVFDAPAYAGHGHTAAVLAAGLLVRGVRVGWNHGLRALGVPWWNFTAGLAELVATAATVIPFAAAFGVVGGAYGVLIASVVGSVIRARAFARAARDADPVPATSS